MPRLVRGTTPVRNFHIPLPEDVYLALRAEAEYAQRPANALAREAITQWLEMRRQARLDREILAYVEAMAGTAADLDPELEAAGMEAIGREA